MRARYRLYFREKTGRYYIHDDATGKQESLHTKDKATAERLFHARNEAEKQPSIALQIGRTYIVASDPDMATRTWQFVMDEIVKLKQGETQRRWLVAIKDKAFNSIRNVPVIETRPQHFLRVLESKKVSTNVYLRRIQNFALDMNWLAWPILAKRQMPAVEFGEKRAITLAEHLAIVAREQNPERKAYYRLAWCLGASQTDLALIEAENVDWQNNLISYQRVKTKTVAVMRLDDEMADILKDLPGSGPLFPYLRTVRAGDRATEFKQRCTGLGIQGISLHSYRYAWAERAKAAGYPERYAQVNLGHNSKALTRAYSRKAEVQMPSLTEWERQQKAFAEGKIAPLPSAVNA